MNIEKILKFTIWAGLIGICFIPLIVDGDYYFPFIVPKTVAFKIVVEIIFLAYLGLAVIKKEYRPKFNLVLLLFILYLATVFVSSILGDSFYFSFWSNNERSEGLLLLLHLFLFLIILSGFLRRLKDWLLIFEASFLSSLLVSLVGLGQYLDLEWVIASGGGQRLTSTLGNAGYVAGYLIFNIFFGLVLFFFRKNKYLRCYYVLGILLQIFVVLNTLSRGGILALTFSLTVFIIYFIFFYLKDNKLVRNGGIIVLLLTAIFVGFLFLNQQADWVQENRVLERIVSISSKATTAQNRLMTWGTAIEGFKEKPVLGYGYENFYQVFDKYFNPKIYRHASSVTWFDRAHNIIFDRLITGGLVGLFLYLGLLFVPLVYLWRYFLKNKTASGYLIPVILTLVMLAYFIQNLFIFEALVTYIPLFLVLAFLSQFCPSWFKGFSQSKKPYLVLVTISIILFLPVIFTFNLRPASTNKLFIEALINARTKEYKDSYSQFVTILDRNTANNQEYRQHFGEMVMSRVTDNSAIDQEWLSMAALKTEQEFDKQIEEKPLSTRNYLMFMRFLNRTYVFNFERLNKALELAEKAKQLSPTRPQIYYEIAYTNIYLGKYYQSLNKEKETQEFFNQAISNMQEAINLQDRAVESYINMIMTLFVIGQSEKVQLYLDRMDEFDLDYHIPETLARMANSAIHAKNYQWTKKFYQEMTELDPGNPDNWVNLALSYAYLGQRERAIEASEKIKEFGGEYVKQSDLFIQDVLDGKFE